MSEDYNPYESLEESKKALKNFRKQRTYIPNQISSVMKYDIRDLKKESKETFLQDQLDNQYGLIKNTAPRGMDLSYINLDIPMNSVELLRKSQRNMVLLRSGFNTEPTPGEQPPELFSN